MRNMAKKKEFSNSISLDDLMREETGQTPVQEEVGKDFPKVRAVSPSAIRSETDYKHCAFICSTAIWNKMQAIAQIEGFTIRQVMEYWMQSGISSYEQKHGAVEPKGKKNIEKAL